VPAHNMQTVSQRRLIIQFLWVTSNVGYFSISSEIDALKLTCCKCVVQCLCSLSGGECACLL